jgi:hypothetical protein
VRAVPEIAVSKLANKTSDELRYSLSLESAKIVANLNIREVLQFGNIMKMVHSTAKENFKESITTLEPSIEDTTGAFLTINCPIIVYQGPVLTLQIVDRYDSPFYTRL